MRFAENLPEIQSAFEERRRLPLQPELDIVPTENPVERRRREHEEAIIRQRILDGDLDIPSWSRRKRPEIPVA